MSPLAVIKYGGHAMDSVPLNKVFVENIYKAGREGWQILIGHGGGPQINILLKKLAIESSFKDGLRITSPEVMQAVEFALCGEVNPWLVSLLCQANIRAVGISGKDTAFIQATQKSPDLGLVGEVQKVDPKLCEDLLALGYVPVLAPIGTSVNGHSLNINADTATGAVAGALRADVFMLVTDVAGVLDKNKQLLPHLTRVQIQELIDSGVINGGMIPKVQSCLHSISKGCGKAFIFHGQESARLVEMLKLLKQNDFDKIDCGTVITEN